jgi:hypothetical protein
MSNIEFVLSLTPKQINKFIEFNKSDFCVGLIWSPIDNGVFSLMLKDKDYRMNYKWIDSKWEQSYEI